jgi:hypothetical protein
VLGQAKNRSPVHLLARFRTRRHEMFRLVCCSGPLAPQSYAEVVTASFSGTFTICGPRQFVNKGPFVAFVRLHPALR